MAELESPNNEMCLEPLKLPSRPEPPQPNAEQGFQPTPEQARLGISEHTVKIRTMPSKLIKILDRAEVPARLEVDPRADIVSEEGGPNGLKIVKAPPHMLEFEEGKRGPLGLIDPRSGNLILYSIDRDALLGDLYPKPLKGGLLIDRR